LAVDQYADIDCTKRVFAERLPPTYLVAFFVALDGFFILVLLPEVTGRIKLFADLAVNWIYVGLTWFIGCALAVLILLLVWLAALVFGKFVHLLNYKKMVSGSVFTGVVIFSLLLTTVVILVGCGSYEVVHESIVLDNWHADKKIRVAFFSDAHLGFDDNVQKLAGVCALIVAEKCDIAVYCGDLVDDMTMLPGAAAQLGTLAEKLPQGLYFVDGNGDSTDGNWNKIRTQLLNYHVKVLNNAVVDIGDSGHPLLLVGIEYASLNNDDTFDPVRQKEYLQKTCAGLSEYAPKILLAHTPEIITWVKPHQFDILLFGHTHGGQVSVGNYRFLGNEYKYISGKYQEDGSTIIVNNGIGQWFPVRINVPQQLHIIDIYPGRQ
jgi:predicted MPP superfamily phosphohydrolase